jgi:hypothetical protein
MIVTPTGMFHIKFVGKIQALDPQIQDSIEGTIQS